jgi:hypothetical protein
MWGVRDGLTVQINNVGWRKGGKGTEMIVECSLMADVSVRGGMLTRADNS